MNLPQFNPRQIPNKRLSAFESLSQSGVVAHDRVAIQKALALAHDIKINKNINHIGLLHRDIDYAGPLREAAVLILLVEQENDFDVVLTVRTNHLRHHAGQVSFVGGAVEQEETVVQAALREANEEIGLNASVLEILGELPIYQTITGFVVTPIIACLSESAWLQQTLRIDTQEVDHVFTVPLSILLNHDEIYVHDYEWENKHRHYYSVSYKDYFIWGASMGMLRNLDLLLRAI